MITIERGDMEITCRWIPEDPGDRWYPGEAAHAEDIHVTWRGRTLENISPRNLDWLEGEIWAALEEMDE